MKNESRTSHESSLRILIVDDEKARAESLGSTLSDLGHSVAPSRDVADMVFVSVSGAVPASDRFAPEGKPVIAVVDRLGEARIDAIMSSGYTDVVARPLTPTVLQAKIAIWSPRVTTSSRLVVDLQFIAELDKLKLDDGTPLVATLVDLFFQSGDDIQLLRQEFAAGNLEAVRALAHNLKSSSANLGLVRFKCVCHKIELGEVADDMRSSIALLPMEFELAKRHLGRAGFAALPKSA